jgi:N-acetylglucosamine kinase-like BadF-type ATPase
MSGPLILGLDGGGTGTTSWIARADGSVLGRGQAGPSNITAIGANAALAALDLSIQAAFQDAGLHVAPIEVACLGIAGFDRDEDKALLKRWSEATAWAGRLVLVNDGDLVLAAGTPEGWGVGLIAGTGSIAVGRDRAGRKTRCGGWGFVLGDEGSAFAVAVAGLRRVARRADGREPVAPEADALSRRLFQALRVSGPSELVGAIYSGGFDRARVASLAPAVVEAASEDPALAVDILEPAGHELAELVAGVARNLGWQGGPLPLALAGSFLLGCPIVSGVLLERLVAKGFEVEARTVPRPVEGALVLARRELMG